MRDGKRMKNVSLKELRYTQTLSTDRVTCSSRSFQIHQGLIVTLCNSEWPRGRATEMELVPRLKTIAEFQSRGYDDARMGCEFRSRAGSRNGG